MIGSEVGGVEGVEGGRRGRRIEVGSRLIRGRVDFFGRTELESSLFRSLEFLRKIGNFHVACGAVGALLAPTPISAECCPRRLSLLFITALIA